MLHANQLADLARSIASIHRPAPSFSQFLAELDALGYDGRNRERLLIHSLPEPTETRLSRYRVERPAKRCR